MLINGKWSANWHPVQSKDQKGGFVRQTSSFRNWVTPDGSAGPTGVGGFKAEAGRYHLYVALTCPWASRALIGRKLKGLENVISLSIAQPFLGNEGWPFGEGAGSTIDHVNGASYMHEIYTRADPDFTGRATVPLLWDKLQGTIVNNESSDILRMLGTGFDHLATIDLDLYPADLASRIDALSERIYPSLNNGVYRAGFASTQEAYEDAVRGVFATLDELEAQLEGKRFLFGERLIETDVRLFVTLVRFDVAYYGLFKCNLKQIRDYPILSRYLRSVMEIPGIADTVNFDHIKRGYYSIEALNPNRIVPVGPILVLGESRSITA
jgi:putative glutathione S-transferase